MRSWIQKAVRGLQKVQDKIAATDITYIYRGGQELIVPARLDVSTGESISMDGVTTYFTERLFKVSRHYLPIEPERGDKILLPIYDETGRVVTHQTFMVMSELGVDVTAPQGNYEDSYRIYAKKVNNVI